MLKSRKTSNFNQFKLLTQKRFGPFFCTQFLGAFNDNIFRNGLIILLTFKGIEVFGLNASQIANVAGALFILPYFLFSAIAGQIADKYEKSILIKSTKLLEIILMITAAFVLLTENYSFLLFILFLMGFQSSLFGPVKYAYIPQKLKLNELIGGNALVESGTYIAIILGLVVGGLAVSIGQENDYPLASLLLLMAILGYFFSCKIPNTEPTDPTLKINWNIFSEIKKIIGFSKEKDRIFLYIIGISWFWFYGSVITLQIPAYTINILMGDESLTTFLLATFAIGIGIGSLACERLSKNQIELGITPIGAIGLSLFTLDLYFFSSNLNIVTPMSIKLFLSHLSNWRLILDLIMIGTFGGIFSVPFYAAIQEQAEKKFLSRIIAANNIINAIFMVSASLLAISILSLGVSIPEFFALISVLNIFLMITMHFNSKIFLERFLCILKN
ncbi:MAG: MFS transporter [Gammaproteobacteria bacterium]|nr:MAG: MFS transporter [Gammaproteobacteria bacterium]